MKRYAILLVGLLTACGDSDADGTSNSDGQDGEGGSGTTTGTTGGGGGGTNTGGLGGVGGTGDGGNGGEPVEAEPFLFQLDGVAHTPDAMDVSSVKSPFNDLCDDLVELNAQFPLMPEDYNIGPKLEVSMCLVGAVLGQPLSLSGDKYTFVQYTFYRPGASYFPKATGTIMPLSDGSDGMFVAIADGTIELDEATVPLHLEINQAATPVQ